MGGQPARIGIERMADEARWENGNENVGGNGGFAWLLGQMFVLPFRTFLYGMERLLDTMRDMQRAGDRGMQVMAGGGAIAPAGGDDPQNRPAAVRVISNGDAGSVGKESEIQEKRAMDRDLNDDTLKLVRFKILFVKREYEHAFPEQEELVSDNMDGTAFTAWKVAEFIQALGRKETSLPRKWGDKYPPRHYVENGYLTGFPEDDKKYLRVYYEVLERYKREKFRYEETQIDVLREIRDKIGKCDEPERAAGD